MKTSKLNLITATLSNLLFPGMGHVYYGFFPLGISILIFGIAMSVGLTHFVALGPWAFAVAAAFVFSFYITILYLTYALVKRHDRKPQKWWMIIFVVYIAVVWPTEGFKRVKTYKVTSDNMVEGLLNGDSIAVDMSKSANFAAGDILIVKLPDRPSEYLRQVQSAEGDNLVIATKDYRFQNETIAINDVIGKAIYIAYSVNPNPFQIRFRRTLRRIY